MTLLPTVGTCTSAYETDMPLEIQKTIDTFRSPFYVECVRKFPCIIASKLGVKPQGRIDPHHVDGVRKAGIGSDARIVPVSRVYHPQSPKAFKVFCREHGLDVEDLIRETQQRFCDEHGYMIGRDGDSLEDILIRAELGERYNPGKRVSHGTAESKGKKLSKLRKLSRACGTPTEPLLTQG